MNKVPAWLILVAIGVFYGHGAAQNLLPDAQTVAAQFTFGWNLGNTMEAIGGPTAWGNPLPSQKLIDSLKAAGFNVIRIPTAWNSYANPQTLKIDTAWIRQVKTVVDYCVSRGMFVILNSHWDGGWLEENVRPEAQATVQRKQGAYWRQIATAFRDYDHHLMFASANEPAVQDPYGTPFGADRMAVLLAYHQAFVDSVRATGGNNASRVLIIQGPRADIELTYQVMKTLPIDPSPNRLMVEVHFYPYQFTLMTEDASWGKPFYYWGAGNHSPTDVTHNPTWGEEAYVDSMFNLMRDQFTSRGIPVIIGEVGAVKRTHLTGDNLKRHLDSRAAFYKYVVSSGKQRGITAIIWDTGYLGEHNMTVIDRNTAELVDVQIVNALRTGWGLPALAGGGAVSSERAMRILYSAKDSLFGQVNLGVAKSDWSAYDSIIVRAYVKGETTYDSAGMTRYGYVSLNLVTMSQNWTWREASLGSVAMDSWKDYRVAIGTSGTQTGVLVPANPRQIDFFALQVYSKGFRGAIYVDHIVFVSKQGARDTLYNFNLSGPNSGAGNVVRVNLVDVSGVPADQEWKTATTSYTPVMALYRARQPARLSYARRPGTLLVQFAMPRSAKAHVELFGPDGRLKISVAVDAQEGLNRVEIPLIHSGVGVLVLRSGERILGRSRVSY